MSRCSSFQQILSSTVQKNRYCRQYVTCIYRYMTKLPYKNPIFIVIDDLIRVFSVATWHKLYLSLYLWGNVGHETRFFDFLFGLWCVVAVWVVMLQF